MSLASLGGGINDMVVVARTEEGGRPHMTSLEKVAITSLLTLSSTTRENFYMDLCGRVFYFV